MNRRHRLALAAASGVLAACSAPAHHAARRTPTTAAHDVESLPAVGAGEESPPTSVRGGQGPTTSALSLPAAPVAPVVPSGSPDAPLGRGSGQGQAAPGRCGGDLPPCSVMNRESGGDPTAVSPVGYCDTGDGRCRGKWQYDALTWDGYGGYANADEAPESVQDEKARSDWAGGAGCSHWGAC